MGWTDVKNGLMFRECTLTDELPGRSHLARHFAPFLRFCLGVHCRPLGRFLILLSPTSATHVAICLGSVVFVLVEPSAVAVQEVDQQTAAFLHLVRTDRCRSMTASRQLWNVC
jgi:hypothetical protein